MAKQSIEITGKVRSALFLLSALWQQGPVVARLVADKLRAGLPEGEEPLDFLILIRGLGQILKAALDLMVELDNLLVGENQRRAGLLDDREDKVVYLGRRITGIRRIVAGHFVAPDVARLGLEGRTARESVALLRQSELISERLVRDDLEELLGDSLFEPPLDLRLYEPQIMLAVDTLREAFEAHQDSRRQVDELRARKREAVKDYDVAFIRVARQFEDLCRLVGLDELADKVRPSLTRKGETVVPPDDGQGASIPDDAGASDAPAEDAAAAVPVAEPVPEPVPEPDSETAEQPAAN